MRVTSTIRVAGFSILALVIVGYSLFQAQKIIAGPVIDIYSPESGSTYNQILIEVTGKARNVAYINMNNHRIFTDIDGKFMEKLLLSPGYNIIKLDATDKFGKRTEKFLQVILKE